jgi:hypothetical protein
MVTYLRRNVTIVCGASYHLLGSQISWDSKIRFQLQVKSNISNWRFSELRHLARYVSRHNAMAQDKPSRSPQTALSLSLPPPYPSSPIGVRAPTQMWVLWLQFLFLPPPFHFQRTPRISATMRSAIHLPQTRAQKWPPLSTRRSPTAMVLPTQPSSARSRTRACFSLLNMILVELYPDLVFWYGIGWYFLGIFLTDTKGKLGKDLWYSTFGGNPFFPRFCPLFDGPSPPFEGSSCKISQNGSPAKSYSTKNTIHTIPKIPTSKCR